MAPSTSDVQKVMQLYMELQALYDDLNRGNEDECLALVEFADKLRQKWLGSYNENGGLRAMLQSSDEDNKGLRQHNKDLKDQLNEARGSVGSLVAQRQNLEADREALERQLDNIRDLMKDDVITEENRARLSSFLTENIPRRTHRVDSMSMVEEGEEIDYDETGDSVHDESLFRNGTKWNRSHGKKRSCSTNIVKSDAKRSKENEAVQTFVTKTTVTIPRGGMPVADLELHVPRRSMNRSMSEPRLPSPHPPPYDHALRLTPGTTIHKSTTDMRSPGLRAWASSGSLATRRHMFISKTTLKPEHCDFCSKRVPFGKSFLRCQDCRYSVHVDCKEYAPIPCVPRNPNVGTPSKNNPKRLVDCCPNTPPMIPHIIIHCVTEIERRGLDSLGLYRIPGSEKEIQDLLDKFMHSRGVPSLSAVGDINALAGVVKRFLTSLRDKLIPSTSWEEFVNAAEPRREQHAAEVAMYPIVADLPQPNRDTLSYLMLHWQRVSSPAMSNMNKMAVENLARCLGPTVVGYSSDSTDMQALAEVPKIEAVVLSLMKLSGTFWERFLTYDEPLVSTPYTNSPATPTMMFSRLGPLPNYENASNSKTPNSAMKMRSEKKQYFKQIHPKQTQPWK